MPSNLSNVEILNNLLEENLDDLNARSLMQRWLSNEIDVQTGAFLAL